MLYKQPDKNRTDSISTNRSLSIVFYHQNDHLANDNYLYTYTTTHTHTHTHAHTHARTHAHTHTHPRKRTRAQQSVSRRPLRYTLQFSELPILVSQKFSPPPPPSPTPRFPLPLSIFSIAHSAAHIQRVPDTRAKNVNEH